MAIVPTTGAFVWAKSLAGTSDNLANTIAVDDTGSVVTTGYFVGTVGFDPGPGSYPLVSAGVPGVFVLKLDVAGNLPGRNDSAELLGVDNGFAHEVRTYYSYELPGRAIAGGLITLSAARTLIDAGRTPVLSQGSKASRG